MAQALRRATSHNNPQANKPDEVPRFTKQPKSRQPSGFREKILRTPLPYYSGPYSVGMMDIEVPVRDPRHFSDITRHKRHLLELETVLLSVFYPSGFGSGQGTSPDGRKDWSRPTWLPRPRVEVAKGYGRFAGLPEWISAGWFGGYETKNRAGTRPPGEPERPCFPLLIFSHGLGGTRTTYSSGGVVDNGKVDLSHKDREKGYSRMDYVFPKNNARDTLPGNKQGVDAELRSAQIQLRLAEIEEACHVMTLIHDGEGEKVAKASLRRQENGSIGGSSRGLQGINWESWRNRFHLQQVTMLGHSFGVATTVEVLRHKDRFQYMGQGIIYDIWGAAVQPPESEPRHRIDSPLLAINSEASMYWPDTIESVMSLCHEAKVHNVLVRMMTVRASLLLKMTVNPRRAIDLNINASLEFLKMVMPTRICTMKRGTNEHLLAVSILEKLPSEHRPNEKWAAMRLRIPHELRIRLRPQWSLPTDPQGNVLEGLEDLQLGEEIWMHVAPTKEELKRHGLTPGKELKNHQSSGMVDVTGQKSRCRDRHRGIEQRYMERG
ncbi:platelet-activating factor acetylhydrolase, isoform II-domain-containing protein [Cadophora sp. MPI-SDFR-AT-0126]|nr:platelet-activating factor acetylhydrolase, isoform II-domain-containing protein [Leotiomycetes sp. MPI-SDFR-AT-0126]